jgi:tRNA 2-thiouridine synthesizing protein B
MTLHTVNKSPYLSQCLADCLDRVSAGDSIVLIEDGVYGINCATSETLSALNKAIAQLMTLGVQFCALRPDIEARGLQTTSANCPFNLLSDGDFVDLVCEADKVLSWY